MRVTIASYLIGDDLDDAGDGEGGLHRPLACVYVAWRTEPVSWL